MTNAQQEQLFGRRFEKLHQERQAWILRMLGGVPQDIADTYERIRKVRNQHLHLSSLLDVPSLARDARDAFGDAVRIVSFTIGQDAEDGRLVLTPAVAMYLERMGKVTRQGETDTPAGTLPTDTVNGDLRRGLTFHSARHRKPGAATGPS